MKSNISEKQHSIFGEKGVRMGANVHVGYHTYPGGAGEMKPKPICARDCADARAKAGLGQQNILKPGRVFDMTANH